jgi:hypothetical protein
VIQQAHLIFQDRINTFKKMKAIDAVLDDKPTKEIVIQFAELRIRNEDCFRELKTLNDTGKFKFVHPLLKKFGIRAEFEKKLQVDPSGFLEEYANTRENVKRYRSFMNSEKRSSDQKTTDKANFEKHQEREKLMKEVLESKNTPA